MEKQCFKCGSVKPLSEFYVHRMMADGRLNKCKDCTRKDVAEREARLSKFPRWRLSEAERHREKSRRYRQAGRVKPVSAEQKREYLAAYRAKYPEKAAAHGKTKLAVKQGKIASKPCEVCGFPITEAHHEDYSKPLNVQWLCSKHHAERHVRIRELQLLTA